MERDREKEEMREMVRKRDKMKAVEREIDNIIKVGVDYI